MKHSIPSAKPDFEDSTGFDDDDIFSLGKLTFVMATDYTSLIQVIEKTIQNNDLTEEQIPTLFDLAEKHMNNRKWNPETQENVWERVASLTYLPSSGVDDAILRADIIREHNPGRAKFWEELLEEHNAQLEYSRN
jgi:hypothetical protein